MVMLWAFISKLNRKLHAKFVVLVIKNIIWNFQIFFEYVSNAEYIIIDLLRIHH